MNALEEREEAAAAVQPLELAGYLRATGWSKLRLVADGAGAVWQHEVAGHRKLILLPLDPSYDDYRDRSGPRNGGAL